MQASRVAAIGQRSYDINEIQGRIETLFADLDLPHDLENRSILIKPNCTAASSPEAGRTTHPAVLEALALVLLGYGSRVMVGESPSVGTDSNEAFSATGIRGVADRLSLPLIDFRRSIYTRIPVVQGLALESIELPSELLEADIVISLAKLKTNFVSTISGTVKNMKGVLLDRDKRHFHSTGLEQCVADLYSVLSQRTRMLGMVDGIVGGELFEPRYAGVLVASRDLLACDRACARMLGIDPEKVRHLGAIEKQLEMSGQAAASEILVEVGEIPAIGHFRTAPDDIAAMAEEFGISITDKNACSSCVGALYYSLRKVRDTRPELLDGLEVVIGSSTAEDSADAIRFGTCSNRNDSALNVQGCPPVSASFIDVIEQRDKR